MARINLVRTDFHGEWNYSIIPNPTDSAFNT